MIIHVGDDRVKRKSMRFYALLLVLALVLTVAPVAMASTGKTVYFENTADWSVVNIYYWSDSNTQFVNWPGKAMKVHEGNIYYFDLPEGVQYVIFNNGGTQTTDLVLPEDQNLYHYDTGSWSQYGCAHSWGDERVITEASCTEVGEVAYTCSICSQEKTMTVEPLGHSFSGDTCSRCGIRQKGIYFDATGSDWSQPYLYTWSGGAQECGAWPGSAMEAVEGVDGLFVYHLPEYPENVIFHNNSGNQTADMTMPTTGENCYSHSTNSWSKYDTCSHEWDQGNVITEATCTVAGEIRYTCALCGETRTETVAAAGHSFVGGSCSVCGALAECENHGWNDGVGTEEETCWIPGTMTYTCTLCGATRDEYIYPRHDTYVAEVIEPTCTKTGKEITKCTRCAYSYDRTLQKIAHNYVAGEKVAPTCTEDGYTKMVCSACGAETQGELVYHTGHSWNGNTCTGCGMVCEHTYSDGICTACGNGGPAYVEGYYEIANAAQLFWFASQVNGGNNAINGKLVADIDLENRFWTSIGYYLSDTQTPDTVPYTGIFDGQGHTVSNFKSLRTDNEGLFGYCSSATIQNLGVIGAQVTGWRAGAVAGYALTSNVINCYAKDCVITGKTNNSIAMESGTVYISPVAGPQGGIVRNCYAVNCTLAGDTTLEVYTSPVGGTDTQNGYYCNVNYAGEFSSVRNSTEISTAQLASGEVTYLLNKGVTDGTQGWYQTCGTGMPAHSGETVYQVTGCGNGQQTYSNDPNATGDHSYDSGVITTAPTCTGEGIKTFTCTGCGGSYTETLPATGHSYTDGICTNCGEADPDYVPELIQPTLALSHPSLTFEDVITMNVYFSASNLEDVVEMGLITFTQQVTEWNVETANAVIPGYEYNESTALYVAVTNGIAAKDMGDTIWFAVYAKLTDGSYTYTKLVDYSPKTYAYSMLTKGTEATRKLCVALLNYGAAAQTYFSYNTDSLMNSNLTADHNAMIESYRADMMIASVAPDAAKAANFANNGGYTRRYPSIVFEGAFSISYNFIPSATPVGDITMYVWDQVTFDSVDVLTRENATEVIAMTPGDAYTAVVDGIAAKDLDKGVYVTFIYSDGTTEYCSGILNYSIGDYCTGKATGNTTMAPFAAATAVYGYYAKEMFY